MIAEKKSKSSGINQMYVIGGIVAVIVVIGLVAYMSQQGGFPTYSLQGESNVEQTGSQQQQSSIPPITVTEPTIELVNYPSSAATNSPVLISWKINSDKEINIDHTAVHYGTSQVADPNAPTDYPSASTYQSGKIPGTFSTALTLQKGGIYYFRAHAIVEGENIWTDEKRITVSAPSTSTTVRTVKLYADDDGFYNSRGDKVTAINAKLGERLKITFEVDDNNVYYGGLDFRSDDFDVQTGTIEPGDEVDVQVTANQEGEISSYWPVSNKLKATLDIVIA